MKPISANQLGISSSDEWNNPSLDATFFSLQKTSIKFVPWKFAFLQNLLSKLFVFILYKSFLLNVSMSSSISQTSFYTRSKWPIVDMLIIGEDQEGQQTTFNQEYKPSFIGFWFVFLFNETID